MTKEEQIRAAYKRLADTITELEELGENLKIDGQYGEIRGKSGIAAWSLRTTWVARMDGKQI